MFVTISQKFSRPLLVGVLFVGFSRLGTVTLFAQQAHVPVGPPTVIGKQIAGQYAVPHAALAVAIPHASVNGGVQLGRSYEGIDFLGSTCGCLPPDTNAAVGNNFVVET